MAFAFAAGIAVSAVAAPSAWLLLAAVAAVAAWMRRRRAVLPLLLIAALALGAGWAGVRGRHLAPEDLAARRPSAPAALRLVGTALAAPRQQPPARGSMAHLSYHPPAWSFPLRAEALRDRHGRRRACTGRVQVRLEGRRPDVRAGDHVEVAGTLLAPRPPTNPGAFDWQDLAQRRGEAGVVFVRDADLIRRRPPRHWWAHLLQMRDRLRGTVRGWLHGRDDPDSPRGALLDAMLLGRRDGRFAELNEAFRGVGLAHLLAVSGMHLGILAGLVLALARIDGRPRRAHGLVLIVATLAYLLVVEARLPVLRAALMLIVASAGVASGRRINVGSLVALSAVLLLAWRPQELYAAGFQLSYGVVLGLIHLAPALRRRWFGPPDPAPPTAGATLLEWLRTALAASCTAWLVAAPIALHHFGLLSPLAAPLSVTALPLATVLLAVGYVRVLVAAVLPFAAPVLDVPLYGSAELLLGLVRCAWVVPGAAVHLPPPTPWWTGAALAWVVLAVRLPELSAARRWLRPAAAALALWLLLPLAPRPWGPALRIDMIDVGDGSCYLLRSNGGTVVFDAGSAHRPDVGRRIIVPALRSLGTRRVDAVIVSHGNLDHCSGALEVVDAFRVGQVLVTPQLVEEARAEPASPAATLLAGLRRRGVPYRAVAAGDEARLGRSAWRWLHPEAALTAPSNQTSMVITVEAAGRRVLLCGDLEGEAAAAVHAAHSDLRADVVELPHHGADDAAARALVRSLQPAIVMQSTGRTRWERDAWEADLRGVIRLVTARDGACWIEIGRDGRMRRGRTLSDDR
jgi:competence protein ComEC